MDLHELTRPVTTSLPRTIGRVALGLALAGAGITHLTVAREEFRAQVPDWFPVDEDVTVLASGVAEIVLGGSLVVLARWKVAVGLLVAAFFVVIFPGNVGQWLEGKDGFGLDTDTKRFVRLFFQPVLVALALWSTGAFGALRRAGRG
ncbi:DoxX family protein [Promicromonospora sp. Marseille-Q5078]